MNPAITPKVIVNMTREGSAVKAASEAAVPQERQSRESLPGLESPSAARRAVAESVTLPPGAVPGPAAAVQGKRKVSAGGTGGSQKRKKSSPAGLSDLP
jgi:hypothetical protein